MPRVHNPKTMTLARDDVEQIARIVGRLETLLVNTKDELAMRVTAMLGPTTSTESLADRVSAIHRVLRRRLSHSPPAAAANHPKQSAIRP